MFDGHANPCAIGGIPGRGPPICGIPGRGPPICGIPGFGPLVCGMPIPGFGIPPMCGMTGLGIPPPLLRPFAIRPIGSDALALLLALHESLAPAPVPVRSNALAARVEKRTVFMVNNSLGIARRG